MATNITPETAYEITSLPFSITQDVDGGVDSPYEAPCGSGFTNPVWFRWTAPADVTCIGFGFQPEDLELPGLDYVPVLSVWTDSLAIANPEYCWDWSGDERFAAINVTPGSTYYFQIVNDFIFADTLGNISFRVEEPDELPVPVGSLFISNDTNGFPAAILSGDDGTVLRMLGFSAFEQGAMLPDGTLLVAAVDDNFNTDRFELYSPNLELLETITSIVVANQFEMNGVTMDGTSFYVAAGVQTLALTNGAALHRITAAGEVGDSWTLPAPAGNMTALAVSGTTAYWNIENPADTAIHRFDLDSETALSDLVAHDGDFRRGRDLELTAAGDILTILFENATADWTLHRHNTTTGDLEQSYSFGSTRLGTTPRFRIDPANPDAVWVMNFPSDAQTAFSYIDLVSGDTLTSFEITNDDDTTAAMFAPSQSCPILVLDEGETTESAPPCPGCGDGPGGAPPETGYGGFPDGPPPTTTPRVVPPDGEAPSYLACSTGGDPATATDPTDGQSLTNATSPVVWVQITLPDATVLRYNAQGLNFTSGNGSVSTPRVLNWGPVSQTLADDYGSFESPRTTITLSDTDRVLRGYLSNAATRHIDGSEVVIYIETRANAAANVAPRVLARGVISNWKAVCH